MNAAATSLHKFVIAFSVGVELIANKVSIDKIIRSATEIRPLNGHKVLENRNRNTTKNYS